jgi:hypothetical protein
MPHIRCQWQAGASSSSEGSAGEDRSRCGVGGLQLRQQHPQLALKLLQPAAPLLRPSSVVSCQQAGHSSGGVAPPLRRGRACTRSLGGAPGLKHAEASLPSSGRQRHAIQKRCQRRRLRGRQLRPSGGNSK